MTLDRRDLLRLGALGSVGAMSRRLAAFANSPSGASIEPDAKVLFVFDRGGNDGVNTVIPLGDADYPTAFAAYDEFADYWNGTVTTVDNAWYSITGGQEVSVLVVRPRTSQPLIPPASYKVSGDAQKDAYAASFTSAYTGAEAYANALVPVLSAFFAGA